MVLKVFIFSLQAGFVGEADQAYAILLLFYLLFDVSELSKPIYDNGCCEIGNQDIKESPIDYIREESAIVTVITFSAGSLADDSLSEQRLNASK